MCGRFVLYDEKENREISELLRELEEKRVEVKKGEVFPTNRALVVLPGDEQTRRPAAVTWGYPPFTGSRVIINARAETAHEKPLFAASFRRHRCLIPSTGFFEWTRDNRKTKNKYWLHLPEEPLVYMAGLVKEFHEELRFVILTTQANDSVAPIHHRMPVVLNPWELDDWLHHPDTARSILQDWKSRPELVSEMAPA